MSRLPIRIFPCYVSQTFNVIKTHRINLLFLTGLLNSRLVRFWLKHKGKMQGNHFQLDKEPLLAIPICAPAASEQNRIAKLVERAIECQHQLSKTRSAAEKERVSRLMSQLEGETQKGIVSIYSISDDERTEVVPLPETGG